MGFARKTTLLAIASCAALAPLEALAYRPFDLTDAAVADFRETEIEFGPVQFRRDAYDVPAAYRQASRRS